MLRISQRSDIARWLFDVWVIAFTALTFYSLHEARDANNHNRNLAKANRQLIRQNKIFSTSTDAKICVRINNINIIIVDVLKRSKANIPKLAYYKEHPEELKSQLDQINDQITKFRPRTCRKVVK